MATQQEYRNEHHFQHTSRRLGGVSWNSAIATEPDAAYWTEQIKAQSAAYRLMFASDAAFASAIDALPDGLSKREFAYAIENAYNLRAAELSEMAESEYHERDLLIADLHF